MSKVLRSKIEVTQNIIVDIDLEKFNESFMAEFRENFYDFNTVTEHVEHLAQLYARGLVDNHSFIEGYGLASEMGIRFDVESSGNDYHIWKSYEPDDEEINNGC